MAAQIAVGDDADDPPARIDDTIWRVAGPDAPAGSRVKIVQADGASLTVAAA